VRRLLIFAAFLALLSLSTAFAASFSTQAEDVASFTTEVSIPVPEPEPTTFWLRGSSSTLPGSLVRPDPGDSDITFKFLVRDTESVQEQNETNKYHVWQTPTVTGAPLVIGGPTELVIFHGTFSNSRITAGLFDCPAAAAAASTVATGCVQIGASAVGTLPNPLDFVTVDFGNVPTTSIAVGHRLRVKVINQAANSTGNFFIWWGEMSRLELGE
jgi:hypothetical protein